MQQAAEGKAHGRASRLQPVLNERSLAPFVRADAITDCSVYWIPVSQFPVRHLQRLWLLEFLQLFGHERKAAGLREEWFLLFKSLYPDLLSTFIDRSSRYVPVTGMTLLPGSRPRGLPTFEEVKTAVESSTKKGEPVDVHQWMDDQAHWFAMKEPEAQRADFFGHGGMFSLYLPPAPAARALPKLPRFLTSQPSYTEDMHRQYEMLAAVQDGFLTRSKEMFGEAYRQDPVYRGLMFVLPLLTARSVVDAAPAERERWLQLAESWFFESPADRGMLLLCKDPDFDDTLIDLLQATRDKAGAYPQ